MQDWFKSPRNPSSSFMYICVYVCGLQVSMLDSIPGLMNAIRMINTYSRYYNTSKRMIALLVKVTNQMITACRAYITDSGDHKV